MSVDNDLNPYAAPVALTSIGPDAIDERLAFSSEVTLRDLQRANTSLFRQVLLVFSVAVAAFLFLVMGLVALGLAVKVYRGGTFGRVDAIILLLFGIAILSLAVLIGTYFARGWLLARRLPFLLGHASGWLSQKTLIQIRANSESELNMETVQCISIHRDCLIIRFHPSPMLFDVIPMRAFERPEAVRAFVNEWTQMRTPAINIFTDPRRLTEVTVSTSEPIPNDAVQFMGQVTTDDVRDSPIFRLLRRGLWTILGIGIGFPCLVIAFGWSTFSWLTLTSLVLPWMLWRAYHRTVGPLMQPNMPIRFASGYMDGEHVCTFSFFEKSRVKWAHFKSMETSDSTIALEHCGKFKMYTLFARRQFASDANWNKAIEIIRGALQKQT